jgi:hypothetical protein
LYIDGDKTGGQASKEECNRHKHRHRRGIRWLISVIVKKMRIRDNGKKE